MTGDNLERSDGFGLDHGEVERFHVEGYLGPFDLSGPADVAEVRRRVDEEMSAEGPRGNHHMYRHLDCPTVYELCADSAITERVRSILGPDLLLWATTLFEKTPGMSDFAWHQDVQYFDLEPPVNVTAWIALTEATTENGCMQFVPASHRDRVPHVEDPSRPFFDLKADPDHVDEKRAIDVELDAGEFVLFNERLLHRSRENTTDERRFGLSARITVPYARVNTDDPKLVLAGEDWSGINETTAPPA